MQKIGIAGGIGSGKSAVGKILLRLGFEVLDCDLEVHRLYATSSGLRDLLAQNFGSASLIEDGVDKKFLADIIFDNPEKRLLLEGLVYPFLEGSILSFFENAKTGKVFLEAALLHKVPQVVEALDAIWLVDAPAEVRLERLVSRGLSRKDAERRIEAQKEAPTFGSVPTFRLQNASDLASLERKILELL